jgi:hypothetical protein
MRILSKLAAVVAIGAFALLVQGCLTAPFMPPMGTLVSSVQAPLDIDYHQTNVAAAKTGEASSISILGLVALGDCSTQAAAQQGGLRTVNTADYDYFNVLGIFQKTTVRVYGE